MLNSCNSQSGTYWAGTGEGRCCSGGGGGEKNPVHCQCRVKFRRLVD